MRSDETGPGDPGAKFSRANGRATRKALREAAVDLFYRHGYKTASLRLLASEIGVQAGSLYNHISNKQDLLYVLLKDIMSELLADVRKEVAGSDSVIEEMKRFVHAHIVFHTSRLKEVYIGNSELRNLEPENHKIVMALRREYFDLFYGIVSRGAKEGLFIVSDEKVVTRILIGMLNGVTGWYRDDGPSSLPELIEIHQALVFRSLGAPLSVAQAAPHPG